MLSGYIGAMQGCGAALPTIFLTHYLIAVRYRAGRPLESWWIIALNAIPVLVVMLGLVTFMFGQHWPGRDEIRAVVFTLWVLVYGAQYALFIDARSRRRRHERTQDDGSD